MLCTKDHKVFVFLPRRRSVGFNQLPPVGPGPASPLYPLHDGGLRQGVVRLQEQDLHHPAQGHEDRGTAVNILLKSHSKLNIL